MPGPIPHLRFFVEERDDIAYHMCQLPCHTHYVPLRFGTCNDPGSWTWESKYSK